MFVYLRAFLLSNFIRKQILLLSLIRSSRKLQLSTEQRENQGVLAVDLGKTEDNCEDILKGTLHKFSIAIPKSFSFGRGKKIIRKVSNSSSKG